MGETASYKPPGAVYIIQDLGQLQQIYVVNHVFTEIGSKDLYQPYESIQRAVLHSNFETREVCDMCTTMETCIPQNLNMFAVFDEESDCSDPRAYLLYRPSVD